MVSHVDHDRAQAWNSPVQGNSKLQELLKVHSMSEPAFPVSRHSFPDYSSIAAPVAMPVEKDRVRLQVGACFCWPSLLSCDCHAGIRRNNIPQLRQANKFCRLCPD